MRNYPYLTYDNVLVWKVMKLLGNWLDCPECLDEAAQIQSAIESHCIFTHQGKEIYAWSIDLDGHRDVYDEPPGSLQLLPFYGFCSMNDHTWMNTMSLIRNDGYELSFAGHTIAEIGCKHAPHPWILSICNSLLSGNKDAALKHLQHTSMDNGVACESVHEDTGECTTGAAFATCAGFLAFALTEMIG
jgi:meiotically up-regulated gene 157 (Mug157) protein